MNSDHLFAVSKRRSMSNWRAHGIFRLLNRLFFLACGADRRVGVMARFYGLRTSLIQRFYAGRPTWGDRVRLLAGKPPCPLIRALRVIFSTGDDAARGLS